MVPKNSLALPLSSVTSVLYHGGGIRFGAFGGPRPQGFAVYHDLPAIYAYLVGLAQFASGLAILFGALERIGSLCVIIVMLGAIYRVDLPRGFGINKGNGSSPSGSCWWLWAS